MYNIIIFGTGVTAKNVLYKLNDKCNIICYLDNNNIMWGKFNEIEVKAPESIKDLKYDFIIIASQFNDEIFEQLISLGVDRKKILEYYKVIDQEFNYVKEAFDRFLESEIQYEALATGISYCALGLRETLLNRQCFKFAFGSQDLYYDYNIVKYILNTYKDKCSKLKYCIIGLSYYSFQYDMSLSSMKNKTSLYYEVLGLSHNNLSVTNLNEEYFYSKSIADKLFNIGNDGKYICEYDKNNEVPNYKSKKELGKIQAERDCNKNYPKTVEENIEIFEEYIELLIKNNIQPIIIVFPTTSYYYENFSEIIENEFKNIIKSMNVKYKFAYLDFFRSKYFDSETDFVDVSHLNRIGAEKMTQYINEYMKKMYSDNYIKCRKND
ncbi:chemotaxis protein [Clostridium butyricum]|uniref:chemotaxis protein n=1 Tax=Clostridium butyricum TaxID=1492 RepID=UPI0013CF5A67|nr:chemotaxis protein [Clostridium butyricum]MCQ2023709.1 chemotaxis protein [Clostridium butyricum]NFB70093.1 chemotaxis protein [Clostridium butyricum]NFB89880.1 chemotaxis protein [Clostridium butyricum]